MSVLAKLAHVVKEPVCGRRMCGQWVLHDTGMTCPMTCPKTLRDRPGDGVRANEHCEVVPEMPCVRVKAHTRAEKIPAWRGHIDNLRPPVDNSLEGTSAWANPFGGRDKQTLSGWKADGVESGA